MLQPLSLSGLSESFLLSRTTQRSENVTGLCKMEDSTHVESVQQSFRRSTPSLRNLPLPVEYPITSKPLFSNLPMKMPHPICSIAFPRAGQHLVPPYP